MSKEISPGSLSPEDITAKMWENAKPLLENGKSFVELYPPIEITDPARKNVMLAQSSVLFELGGDLATYDSYGQKDIFYGEEYLIIAREYPLSEWPSVLFVAEKRKKSGTTQEGIYRVYLKTP